MLCLIICGLNGPIYSNTHASTGLDTNQPPSVDFTYKPTNPTDIDVVQFHDNSVDTDGWIVAWIWYFGDGDSSILQNPGHKYSDNGIFQISLTVIDNNGTINTTTKTITILNVPPVADCGDDRYVNQNVLNLTASQSYDIDQKATVNNSVNIVRKIHCWSGSLYWVPIGSNRGFGFKLFVSAIPEIKFDNAHDSFLNKLQQTR